MPLFWSALAFVTGILISHWIMLPVWAWITIAGIFLFLFLLFSLNLYKIHLYSRVCSLLRISPLLLLFIFALGGLRYLTHLPQFDQNDLAFYNDQGSYLITVVIDKSPDKRENATYLHAAARELYNPETMTYSRITGAVLIRTEAGSPWKLGDMLQFSASPQTPSEDEDFSYRAYLEHQNIYSIIYHPVSIQRIGENQAGWLERKIELLQQKASKTIFALFPQPESGLLAGILLGNDNNLPQETKETYQETGTAHIIAISGFNMVILAAVLTALFSRVLNRWGAILISCIGLTFYAIFVGGSPSVVRALIMAILAFGGQLIGRRHSGLNALGLAAGGMCLVNPFLPWNISFQLSFSATFGLLLFGTPLQELLEGRLTSHFEEKTARRLASPISEYFLFTLAAQITTLPVIALQFKRISLSSLIANPLVLPAQPAVLIAGAVSTMTGIFFPSLGKILASVTWPLLAYSNRVVQLLAKISWGTMTITFSTAIWISLILILLILLFLFRNYFKKLFKNIRWFYIALFMALITIVIWAAVLRRPDGNLHLSLIRAEEGSSILLELPQGETILIDPGGSSNELTSQISQQLSPWNFHIDAVLLTSRESISSLESINERLPIRAAILAPAAYQIGEGQSALLLPENIRNQKWKEESTLVLENGIAMQMIAADAEGTALLVTYENNQILIPGGVEPELIFEQKDHFKGLSILILNEEDTEALSPAMWKNLGAQMILWNSPSIAPDADWQGLDEFSQITLIMDGKEYSFTMK